MTEIEEMAIYKRKFEIYNVIAWSELPEPFEDGENG